MTKAVRKFIISVVVLLALLDVVLFLQHGVDATFSRVIVHWAERNPAIAFAAGFLCGHLFWPQRLRK